MFRQSQMTRMRFLVFRISIYKIRFFAGCRSKSYSKCRVLTALTSALKVNSSTAAAAVSTMQALDFEVYGRVQGVFFRKHTKQEADKLGVRGWCKNTAQGTVLGHMEGPTDKVQTMMTWLKTTGSPSSNIEKAEFRNQKNITEYTFDDFGIVRD